MLADYFSWYTYSLLSFQWVEECWLRHQALGANDQAGILIVAPAREYDKTPNILFYVYMHLLVSSIKTFIAFVLVFLKSIL